MSDSKHLGAMYEEVKNENLKLVEFLSVLSVAMNIAASHRDEDLMNNLAANAKAFAESSDKNSIIRSMIHLIDNEDPYVSAIDPTDLPTAILEMDNGIIQLTKILKGSV